MSKIFSITFKNEHRKVLAEQPQGLYSLVSVGNEYWGEDHLYGLLDYLSQHQNKTPHVFFVGDTLQRFNYAFKDLPFYSTNEEDPKYNDAIAELKLEITPETYAEKAIFSSSELNKNNKPSLAALYRHMYTYKKGNKFIETLLNLSKELKIDPSRFKIVRWNDVLEKKLPNPVLSAEEFEFSQYKDAVMDQATNYFLRKKKKNSISDSGKNKQEKCEEPTFTSDDPELLAAIQYVDEEARHYESIFMLALEKIETIRQEIGLKLFKLYPKIYEFYPTERGEAFEHVANCFDLKNQNTKGKSSHKTKLSKTPRRIELKYTVKTLTSAPTPNPGENKTELVLADQIVKEIKTVRDEFQNGLNELKNKMAELAKPASFKETTFKEEVVPEDYYDSSDSDNEITRLLKEQLEEIQKEKEEMKRKLEMIQAKEMRTMKMLREQKRKSPPNFNTPLNFHSPYSSSNSSSMEPALQKVHS